MSTLAFAVSRSTANPAWTLTRWENEEAMKGFRVRSPHRKAMSKLVHWCDEAAVAHWIQESQEWPSWEKCVEKLLALGRLSKVNHPSRDQEQGHIIVT